MESYSYFLRKNKKFLQHPVKTPFFFCICERQKQKSEKKEENEMNKVILMGRLTKAPEIKFFQDDNKTAMARYTP